MSATDQSTQTAADGNAVVEQVDPRTLLVDLNIRRDARADADLIASVGDLGVLVPIVAVRTAEGRLRVRFGHRRTAAAIEAGRGTVPVVVAADEATDEAAAVERLVTQWAENEHRTGLTTAERVDTINQLAAFGVSHTQISKRTRAKRGEIDAALAVASSGLARGAVDRYDFLDLAQAAVVAEFDDDPETVTALVAAAKTGQFDHTAQRIRDARAEQQRRTALAEQLTAAGVDVIDWPAHDSRTRLLRDLIDGDSGDRLTSDGHAVCPGHAAYVSTTYGYLDPATGQPVPDDEDAQLVDEDPDEAWDDEPDQASERAEGAGEAGGSGGEAPRAVWGSYFAPTYVCTDPGKHGHRDRWGGQTVGGRKTSAEMDDDEREAARAARRDVIESNKAWGSAEIVRRDWLRALFTRKTAPKDAAKFLAVAIAHDADTVAAVGGNHLAADLLGLDAGGYGRSAGLAAHVEQASEGRALMLTVAQVLAAYEDRTSRDDWRHVRPWTVRYLRFLERLGYHLAPVERRACGDTISGEDPADD